MWSIKSKQTNCQGQLCNNDENDEEEKPNIKKKSTMKAMKNAYFMSDFSQIRHHFKANK